MVSKPISYVLGKHCVTVWSGAAYQHVEHAYYNYGDDCLYSAELALCACA